MFQTGEAWWQYFKKHKAEIRPAVIDNVVRMLACGLEVMGYASHCSSTADYGQRKKVCFSCKSRFCPTCGKKATDQWIAPQTATLPRTRWQHTTLTMPSALWKIFHRSLLKEPSRLAAGIVKKTAQRKGILPGIFTALHTLVGPAMECACPSERDLRWRDSRRRAVEAHVFRESADHADVALRDHRSVARVIRRAGAAGDAQRTVFDVNSMELLAE
ncbi:hypothetical protein WT83_16680 [Burkholderia territorii]|uniref:Transposase zinc-binding domain-containing protein n=1 Tax=Burkholderia territorii TaxID=1503055 RepID=A0A108ENY5_9BURK|nr:transposase zinc-binding domain-containing protein [Burkholderia territorii]KWN14721.1 hypothetical protein WT83_16680 [Burkholderia territorii]